MKVGRRAFLKQLVRWVPAVVAYGVAFLTGHYLLDRKTTRSLYPSRTLPYRKTGRPGIIRPPGAVAEPEFLAGCIRCYRCQDVCDTGAVQFFTERESRTAKGSAEWQLYRELAAEEREHVDLLSTEFKRYQQGKPGLM